MAAITPSTFNPLARFVNVRLQQGVPIVDADVNELDDIRKFELRAFLKWFVGDGNPDGNDGFRISVTEGAGDEAGHLVIGLGAPAGAAGASPAERGLRNVGRMIVDGLDVMIEKEVRFDQQPLSAGRPASAGMPSGAEQAQLLSVPTTAMPAVPAAGTVAVYLDVWESLVTASDENGLLHEGLGVETCARMRRHWVVRARLGDTVPRPSDPAPSDHLPGHSYVLLAEVEVHPDRPIRPADVDDRRHRRLRLPPATLVEDVLGTTADAYRAGRDRPPISLREAVNALLRGELPMTEDAPIAPSAAPTAVDTIARAFLTDRAGGVVGVFTRVLGDVEQVYAARLRLDAVAAGFGAPVALTSGVGHSRPSVAELPDGTLFVVYQAESAGNANIQAKHATFAELASTPEFAVAATADVVEDTPFVVAAGGVVTVFFHKTLELSGGNRTDRWYLRRWSLSLKDWTADPKELAPVDTRRREFHAAADSDGKIWAVFHTGTEFSAVRVEPSSGEVASPVTIEAVPANLAAVPFVLCPAAGGVSVFFQNGGIRTRRLRDDQWADAESVDNTGADDRSPCAVEDGDGALYLLWSRGALGERDLLVVRRDTLGRWGLPRQVVTSPHDDTSPFAVAGADSAVWLFWNTDRTGKFRVYYKRIVTAL